MFRRISVLALAAACAVALAPAPAAASDQTAVMATLHHFIDGFNRGDMKMMTTGCASPASIIDDFPPHEWHGPTACADWAKAYDAAAAQGGITDGIVTIGAPWHVAVTGDRAYVVVPARYTYDMHGKPVVESGSLLTVAFEKKASAWLITGWAWSQH